MPTRGTLRSLLVVVSQLLTVVSNAQALAVQLAFANRLFLTVC